MKVVITADSYLPRLGGQEMGAFRLAKYLRKTGQSVTLVTTEKHAQEGPEAGGLEVIRAPHRFDPVHRRRLGGLLAALFRDADVVHSRYCYRLAALSAPIARRIGRRFVVSLHGLGLLDNPADSALKKWSHRRYRRLSLSGADAVIATSSEFARLAARYADPARIQVIPNGVDTDEFRAGTPPPESLRRRYEGHPVVLAMRRLVPKNGIQYLIQAAPLILSRCPEARFVIGGWGSQEPELRRLTRDRGLEERVDFVGAIPNSAVAGYLAAAQVVVFPSTMESTSHACLEAMAMGRPVVASRLGGLEELLGEGDRGVLVELMESGESTYDAPALLSSGAAARLAGAILRLLLDPAEAERIGAAGRRYALDHFDWNVLVERILEVYRG
ncbi:MAG TPA: glycosyltransferase family 4 protein [Candidatus Polarisedimenticolia bacterium]|jgi:glycosyltransferase involved in cell wall biosynthesis|nr:glycosyltransferase family 4 protein [Candidatus Polarisedimenticolia bacterium]